MHYMLPFTFVMWRLVSFWRSPQENNHPLQCVLYYDLILALLVCTTLSLFPKGMLKKRHVTTYWVTDPIFLPLLCFCKPVHLIAAYGEELWWTLVPGKCNCSVLSVSLERAASSLMTLTLEIETSAVTGWELLPPELLTLLQRSSGRVSIVPGKGGE